MKAFRRRTARPIAGFYGKLRTMLGDYQDDPHQNAKRGNQRDDNEGFEFSALHRNRSWIGHSGVAISRRLTLSGQLIPLIQR